MLRRGVNNPNRARVGAFVSSFVGEAVPAKITTNVETALRAYRKQSKWMHRASEPEMSPRFFGGMVVPLTRNGKRNIVFANKRPVGQNRLTPLEMEQLLAHERTHVWYIRRQGRLGRKQSKLTDELLAGLVEIEYAKQHKIRPSADFKKQEKNRLRDAVGKIPTDAALCFAFAIHNNFPAEERKVLFNEVANTNFQNLGQMYNWLRAKLKARGKLSPQIEREIEEGQKEYTADILDRRERKKKREARRLLSR